MEQNYLNANNESKPAGCLSFYGNANHLVGAEMPAGINTNINHVKHICKEQL